MKLELNKKAFTLIELLVVIAIIGILSGLIVVSMNGATNSANDAKRKANISTISKALMVYGTLNGNTYPVQTTQCNIAPTGITNRCANFDNLSDLLPVFPVDSNGTYYKYFSNNGSTFTVSAVLSNGQFAVGPVQQCPTNWIDSGHGFCVMKYEASTGTIDNGGQPWVSITRDAAKTACSNLGNGSHLITNAEWTVLARDIESVGSNWTGGSVGSGILKRGNVGIPDAGSYIGGSAQLGTVSTDSKSTLALFNGQTINHLSGNVWEWVDDTTVAGTGTGFWSASNAEWNNSALSDYEKATAGPVGNYTTANGVGYYWGRVSDGVLRGGNWGGRSGTAVGFRCAR
ncbi:MAG: prepilin-type N-terminal cleavage/methylation domain-containing protein [Candidatus Paceibacterota bacterium]|jgi:prepilin-type N-terminal cleavage/methylation domain-containing protein